ncbi:LOW QUALITY PROTEIN: hypothetical protein CVT26_001665 [Gymnopilus dilepis]|uniref:Uncharacterized protein n=1 Tax=Gymnopilus dilepis TaxID=231916 RepID=A0A409WB46_9AGAR|nr:LOW QUALITY PROTEIN: hypothetical protein CVT26_001665 [Gymnopilus dilepis]
MYAQTVRICTVFRLGSHRHHPHTFPLPLFLAQRQHHLCPLTLHTPPHYHPRQPRSVLQRARVLLYTGERFEETFKFPLEEAKECGSGDDDDPDALHIDKLRKDLEFMWRSMFDFGGNHENTTAIFSSHWFIQLTWPHEALMLGTNGPLTLTLPSPPFTPASLHFTSNLRHFLCHESLAVPLDPHRARRNSSLHRAMNDAWTLSRVYYIQQIRGTGGCGVVNTPGEHLASSNFKNPFLERGAGRAIVDLFSEGWCTQKFASLAQTLRESILNGLSTHKAHQRLPTPLGRRTHLQKLPTNIDTWADVVRDATSQAEKLVEEVLCTGAETFFDQDEGKWIEIMRGDEGRFEDAERVEWVTGASGVLRGVKKAPHPSDVTATPLGAKSHVRVQVKKTRIELLKWIVKYWITIRQEKGFHPLEVWAYKGISDPPTDDLLPPPTYFSPKHSQHSYSRPSSTNANSSTNTVLRTVYQHPRTSEIDAESDAGGSMLVSVLSCSVGRTTPARSVRGGGGGDAKSVRSAARSTHSLASSFVSSSTASTARNHGVSLDHHHYWDHHSPSHANGSHNAQMSPVKQLAADVRAGGQPGRPDSKLLPSSISIRGPSVIEPSVQVEEREEGTEDAEDEERSGIGDKKLQISALVMITASRRKELNALTKRVAVNLGPRMPPTAALYATPPIHCKLLIIRASLASVRSGTGGKATSTSTATSKTRSPQTLSSSSSRSKTTMSSVVSSSSMSISSPTASRFPSATGSTRSRVTTTTTTTTTTTSHTGRSSVHPGPFNPSSRVSTRSISSSAHMPVSTLSSATDRTQGTSFKAATSGLSTPVNDRSRRTSAASMASVWTAGAGGTIAGKSPVNERNRKISRASDIRLGVLWSVSVNPRSHGGMSIAKATPVKRVPPTPKAPVDPNTLSPASVVAKRPRMQTSRSAGPSAPSANTTTSAGEKSSQVIGMVGRKLSPLDKKLTESLASKESVGGISKEVVLRDVVGNVVMEEPEEKKVEEVMLRMRKRKMSSA